MHFETRLGTPRRPANSFSKLAFALPAIAAASVLLLAGCQSPTAGQQPGATSAPLAGPGTPSYSTNLLEEGDTVSITFQHSTNYDAVSKIGLDGTLNLQSIGQVKAAGQTPLELQTELSRLYRPQIKDDVVTVRLVAAAAGVYLCGAVFHPGKILMDRPMTVLEAIVEAGGFDPSRAKLTDAVVLRIESGKQRAYHVNLKRMLAGKDETPFYLKPFDIVNVQE